MEELFLLGKKESSVESVLSCFRNLLLEKKLKAGDILPSEYELAERLGVGRGTVREAMKVLSAFGIVEIKRGDGTYISGSVGNSLFDPFLFSLIMCDADTRQLVELRQMMEYAIVRLVIQNAGDAELQLLERAYAEMAELAGPVQTEAGEARVVELDLMFHMALGHATGNVYIEKIYCFILDLFKPYIEKSSRRSAGPANALALHGAILAAIRKRDLAAAVAATENSIAQWSELFSLQD